MHRRRHACFSRTPAALGVVCGVLSVMALTGVQPAFALRPSPSPSSGLLYYAKDDIRQSAENTAAVENPNIAGALFQVVWSEIEKQDGECDWSRLDERIAPWAAANKKVAVRILWSTSGYWPNAVYKTPTPRWVWDKGAKFVRHEPSGTEIPLAWDPVYRGYAWRFLEQFAERYGDNPNILFVDVTPGAETNPYRFGTINRRTPVFQEEFRTAKAGDGRIYGDDLWLETVKEWIDAADRLLPNTPLLVTLNVGGLGSPDRSVEIGDYCVSKGIMVGQNGLAADSYRSTQQGRAAAFLRWSENTPLFFEMAHQSGRGAGSLMEVMKAAERIHAAFVNVYPEDVLKGTRGNRDYDPSYEAALGFGRAMLAKAEIPEGSQIADAGLPQRPTAAPGGRNTRPVGPQRPRDREPSWRMPPVEGANLHYATFESKAVGEEVSYLIYLPPGYEASEQARYPVVYWLHGIGGSQQGVPAMTQRLSDAITRGKTPAMIFVFVNGMVRGSYVDSKDGEIPVETVAIDELIPHVDATYRTIVTRDGRMIEGFSMGGAGAAKWGLRHPDLFGSISIIDGALHSGDPTTGRLAASFERVYGGDLAYYDAHDPWKLVEKQADKLKGRTPIRIVTGDKGLGAANRAFHEHLTKHGLTNELHIVPGAPHSPNPLYEGIAEQNWPFYRRAFEKATDAQHEAP